MEAQKDAYKKEYRRITVKTTEGSILLGNINIGIKSRVSDLFLKSEDPFIVMFDVEHKEGSGKIFFVNKDHIVWVEPEE